MFFGEGNIYIVKRFFSGKLLGLWLEATTRQTLVQTENEIQKHSIYAENAVRM